ncbi:transglycosylase [Chelatococcus reniformis]|uniref:Transglycosylase n=2 Tax=Chelatococcus reniformis TaxID=1494448 RepID=A0A916XEX3_9HYPH|nr:transglycosylase [Chelatococcus reniformis]
MIRGADVRMTFATVLSLALALGAWAGPAAAADFPDFVASLKPEAQALGVSAATFDAATTGLTPDLSLPNLDRGQGGPTNAGQAEFTATPAQYLSDKAIGGAAGRGRALLASLRPQIAAIERRFGVPGPIVLAIFGRESGYGTQVGKYDAVRTLATQAWAGRRRQEYRGEFLYALKLLQDGVVSRAALKSSWAGAIGMAQMLPSQYYKYAVNLDGSGRPDIWRSTPDTLASIANHLKGEGWRAGEPWALEVVAPRGVDCTLGSPEQPQAYSQWLSAGFRPVDGNGVASSSARFALLLPAGPYGPGFLIGTNYFVLKAYNFSDLYVLYVGHLADRIAGGGSFATPWSPVTQPSASALAAMQRKLAALGIYADKIDGKAGMKTRLAVGAFQKARGLPVDCWPDAATLRRIAAD